MQEKLKKIIDSYPEFSRETVFNIVSEFNKKTLEEKKNQNWEEILESFTVFGSDKIYLFEKTSKKYKLIIIHQKENSVFIKYRELFQEEKIGMNFSKGVDIVEKGIEWEWDSLIDIKFTSGMKEDDLKLHFFYYFYIYKDGLEYFLFKNIMLYLSKKSLVALDFVKALKEVEKYNVVFEIPSHIILNTKDFFLYGTLASMIAEKKGIKQAKKFRKLPISFVPAALVCNIPKNAEFIFSDIARNKEIYLKANSDLCFSLCIWEGFVMSFLEVNGIAEKWKLDLKTYEKGETKNKEQIDIIYDILDTGKKLGEANILNRLIKKNTFDSVNKMAEQLKKKLMAQEMKTVKQEKFEISKEFKELEIMLKKQFPSIELINEEQRLFLEGFEQKNCAYSYMEKIKDNKEIIFSLKVEKENENNLKISSGRYTIGIKKNMEYLFEVTDVRKKSNISDEDTKIVFEKISEIIKELNKKNREKERIKVEQEIMNNSEEENNINFDIPEWFDLYIERYCGSHLIVNNSKILCWASKKFNNDSYEKFKNGNLRNKLCSFGKDNFFEFSYNENGIMDITYTNIGDEPSSLKKENPELLKEVQTFYEEIIKEMKEKEAQNKN